MYEIALDGKKFPINIAYHASGIKVAQESGCIGLGWALQGYGAITKQVRGFDDFESFPKGYYWNTNLPIPTEDNGYVTKMDQLVNVRIIRFIVKETESPTYFILILEIIVVLCFFNAMGLGIT